MDDTKHGARPKMVSLDEWQRCLDALRVKEKALTRQGDAVSAARRRLPMVEVADGYQFRGHDGEQSLLDLFGGRRQLIVYHFMFAPDAEEGCSGCSWLVDGMSHPAHLHARDISLVLASRAALGTLDAYKARMGWDLPWVSCSSDDFNTDMGVLVEGEDWHGLSVFLREDDMVYRTYFTGDRGVEHLGSHWTYLDLTPFGRQEAWEDSPAGWPQDPTYSWFKRHDEYQ